MINNIPKFFELVKEKFRLNEVIAKKLPSHRSKKNWNNYKSYITSLKEELNETVDEIKKDNSIYLEDELWDIFWTYINLLYTLEEEWYINTPQVFDRAYKKYNERVDAIKNWIPWEEIKEKQKEKLEKEHYNTYN